MLTFKSRAAMALLVAVSIGLAATGAHAGRIDGPGDVGHRGDGGNGGNGGNGGDNPIVINQPDKPKIEPPNLSCHFEITPLGVKIVWENTGGAIPKGMFVEATVEGYDFASLIMYLDKSFPKGSTRAGFIAWNDYWTASKFEGKDCIATLMT